MQYIVINSRTGKPFPAKYSTLREALGAKRAAGTRCKNQWAFSVRGADGSVPSSEEVCAAHRA